jgi:starch synthase (maltosyl-transferring)
MTNPAGQKRVIITNISPQVECGTYPAKAAIDEEIIISADIFCDGHDAIDASVFIKHEKDRTWKEFPMSFINNDHWEKIFIGSKLGSYHFYVQGWIDHFITWKKGLLKKLEAGLEIAVELQIGVMLLEENMVAANSKDKAGLKKWIDQIKVAASTDDAIGLILLESNSDLAKRTANRTFATKYPQVFKINVEPRKALFSTWYELFPRSTSAEQGRHGTFKDVKRLLPRIANMGFDVLYFPPIHPIGKSKRKGKNNSLTAEPNDPGSPWAIGNSAGGHKAIHEELGTLKDLKGLITEAKKFDIDIAMDIAYQCAPDHPYVKEHPQWFKWRPDGTVQYAENPPKKYEDILPFNFETDDWKNLWDELKSIVEYWIDKGVEIFRVDNPHTKSFPFWEWMMPEIKKKHPQVIFLAEAFTRPRLMERLAKVGFTQSYTYFTWRDTKKELQEYLTELTKTDLRYYFRPNFWPNTPDILPPGLTHGGENAHIIRLMLAATMSSNYGLYGPVYEFGINIPYPGKEEYTDNEKYEIKHWDWNKYTRIKELITRINKIRKENAALQTTWNIEFAETSSEQIICYSKADRSRNNVFIIAVNIDAFNTQSAQVKIPVNALGIDANRPYRLTDLLSGDKYTWHGEWNYVALNPYEMPAHIFKVEQ